MRHRIVTTALAVSLLALACTEDRESPTEPSNPASTAKLCPSSDPIQQQICNLFRPTDNLASASDFYNNIKTKKGKDTAAAQARAIDLVNFTFNLFRQGKLLDPPGSTTTEQGAVNLTCSVLAFVSTASAPTSCGDLATTGLTPSSPHSTIQVCGPAGCLVQPQDKHSGVSVPAGACPTPCIISVDPLPVNQASPRDGPLSGLTNLDQYPLFREFKLSAAFTEFSKPVLVGICHLKASDGGPFAPPDDATEARLQLAHPNPNNSEGIEILAKVNAPFLACADLLASDDEFTPVIGARPSHLGQFASAAGRILGQALSPVLQRLLPERAEAAVLGSCCLGGSTTKFSPWAAVDPESGNDLSFTEDPSNNDPIAGNYFKGVTLDVCGDGCYPAVEMLDGETPVGAGTNVTVSLIQTGGTGGVLSGTLTRPIDSESEEAVFDDLTISAPGTYKLMFTAPGARPLTSAEFHVYTMAFTVQPSASPGGTFTQFQFLGQDLEGFDENVVQVSILDFAGDVVSTSEDVVRMSITDGILNGDKEVEAVNGVASFTEIVSQQQGLTVEIETAIDDVSLQASADYFGDTNPVQATSTTFNVVPGEPPPIP